MPIIGVLPHLLVSLVPQSLFLIKSKRQVQEPRSDVIILYQSLYTEVVKIPHLNSCYTSDLMEFYTQCHFLMFQEVEYSYDKKYYFNIEY